MPIAPPEIRRLRAVGRRGRQSGATMVEFTLVAPLITLVGLLCLQWALTFHGRNQLHLAGFMAARAGSTAQAQPAAIEAAHARALAPLYGGGRSLAEVEQSALRARADLSGRVRIQIVNPSLESFADWSDPTLQARLGAARRVIPNDGLTLLSQDEARRVGRRSGQTLADANQLRLRITTGLPLQVPFAAPLVSRVLQWSDDGQDAFVTGLLAEGRMPMTVDVMVRMQSHAMESDATASALVRPSASGGQGATWSGSASSRQEPVPAACSTLGCSLADPVSVPLPAQPVSSSIPVLPAPGQTTELPGHGDPLFCPSPA